MQVREVVVHPLARGAPIDVSEAIQEMRREGGESFELHGVQFENEMEVERSLLVSLYSLANVFSLSLPNPRETKEAIKRELKEREAIRAIASKGEIRFQFRGKSWVFNKQTGYLERVDSQQYMNRVFKTEVKRYPGLCSVKIGEESFNLKEPLVMFDSNEWAFAVGGANYVEVFSNGKRFAHKINPLKLKFGPGGLYIIDSEYKIHNILYERYSDLSYSKIRQNKQIEVSSDHFEIVPCGRIVFLIESDFSSYLRISAISSNSLGSFEETIDYRSSEVVSFGGYSENDQILVVYFVYESGGGYMYEEFKFGVNIK